MSHFIRIGGIDMKEITIDEIIKRNTDYSKQPYTLSLVQPDKGIKFDDWDDKDGKLQVVISNKKGIKLYDSRKKLARYLATKLNHTAREIEDIIAIEGCEKINEMHSGYRCCYLLFDKWLLVDDKKSNKYIGG